MTIFLNLLQDENKELALRTASEAVRASRIDDRIFSVSVEDLQAISGAPFAYWVSARVLETFKGPKFDNELHGRSTRCGLGTLDDFRFIRTSWEIRDRRDVWVTYFHGGIFSRFYDDFPLVVQWARRGHEVKAFVEAKVGSASRKVQGEDKYFQAGFVFPRRTKAFSPKFMPRGGIFSTGGQAGFAPKDELPQTVGLLASRTCTFLISLSQGRTGDAAQFEVGLVKRLPWPDHAQFADQLAALAHRSWSLRRELDSVEETSGAFVLPRLLRTRLGEFDMSAIELELAAMQRELDDIALRIYALERQDCIAIHQASADLDDSNDVDEQVDADSDTIAEPVDADEASWSWCVGVAFGRFDWRLATGEREPPPAPDPFDPLPAKSPGMLPDGAEPFYAHAGILVDDPGHRLDLARIVEEVLERVDMPVPNDVRRWLQREFFAFHLQRYSKSRRKAPIYWPLSTTSGGYTLWVYYPSLSSQTLYTAINDLVEPKLAQAKNDVTALLNKGAARSRDDEKQLEILQTLELELIELRDTLFKVAQTYHPSHDDGVQITAAPLWPLFRHKPWQKVLKDTWAKLEKGEYDWAHLAMNCWPERVRTKCETDKSLAIAHGLEQVHVAPNASQVKTPGQEAQG